MAPIEGSPLILKEYLNLMYGTSMKNTGDIISILVLKSTIHCSRTAVVHNLRRAQKKWERLSRVLEREVRDARNLVIIYVVVVQAVLLYGLETWVMTPQIGGDVCTDI